MVTPEGVLEEAAVEVSAGRIIRVGGCGAAPDARVVELEGDWLLPGLIDLHLNDGVALLRRIASPQEHAERLAEVSRALVRLGVTGMVLATLAAPEEELVGYLEGMALFRRRWNENPRGAELCGALIEGTFMNPDNCGAHNPRYIHPPDRELLERLLAPGAARMVNIAPEFGDRALELIEYAAGRGIIPAAGHCKPTADQLARAVDRGLKYFIHLLNGPTGSNTKGFFGGGTLEGALRDDRLAVELIVDLIHVAPPVVRDVIARKGPERVIAVSDNMFPTDPPAGEFEIGGILGKIDHERGYISVVGRRQPDGSVKILEPPRLATCDFSTLYGSAVNQDRVFLNLLNLLAVEMEGWYTRSHPALPLPEAVRQAALMCATTPAQVGGLLEGDSSERRRGAVAVGLSADLIVARIARGSDGRVSFAPRQVWLEGVLQHEA